MSYQVLARKWRPRRFSELVGQQHVLRALDHALAQGRIHHAYLFSGTRGIGKTTIARILAKCLNCEQGVSAEPCGVCASCRSIDEGRFVDLIEVDAASRTGVDDTRELLDNVPYAPTQGRYKVYLIDEVHMFSRSSFNALLKTLEEPPEHVKFLLATTDPQRLPATVLSRCLQFHLKRLPSAQISSHLAEVLEAEGISHDGAGLNLLARAAEGSMRDALSLLDQAVAHGDGRIERTEVAAMLGTLSEEDLFPLLEALADGDGEALLGEVERLAELAIDFEGLLERLISLLHQIAIKQILPTLERDLDADSDSKARIEALAKRMAAEELQLNYQIALLGRRDLPLAPEPRLGFEMLLLRMLAFRPGDEGATASSTSDRGSGTSGVAPTRPPVRPSSASSPQPKRGVAAPRPPPHQVESSTLGSPPLAALERLRGGHQQPPQSNAISPPAPATERPPWEPEPRTASLTSDAPVRMLPAQEASDIATPADAIERSAALKRGDDHRETMSATAAVSSAARTAAEGRPPNEQGSDQASGGPSAAISHASQGAIDNWIEVADQLALKGIAAQVAQNCVLEKVDERTATLRLTPSCAPLLSDGVRQQLTNALGRYYQRPLKVEIEIAEVGAVPTPRSEETPAAANRRQQEERRQRAIAALEQDQLVRALVDRFDAVLQRDTVRPVGE